MKKVAVLGAGMIGSVIARDLSHEYNVTVVDKDSHKLNILREDSSIRTIISDLNSEIKIQEIIIDYDLIICALPGFMGFKALKSIVSEVNNVFDISFSSEDCFNGFVNLANIVYTIGTIINVKKVEKSKEITNDYKYCISCGEKISKSAKFCPYCGKNLMWFIW